MSVWLARKDTAFKNKYAVVERTCLRAPTHGIRFSKLESSDLRPELCDRKDHAGEARIGKNPGKWHLKNKVDAGMALLDGGV
jgi:hypothetical protein